jgi:Rrf2 family protein
VKFSAQEEFGLRCLLAIARSGPGSSLTIPEISRIEGLGQPHVAKILAVLRNAGLIVSCRGQSGGYSLGTTPDKIYVRHALETLGGKLVDHDFCNRYSGQQDSCQHQDCCTLMPLWQLIQSAVNNAIGKMTLQDLMLLEKNKQNSEPLIRLTSVGNRA